MAERGGRGKARAPSSQPQTSSVKAPEPLAGKARFQSGGRATELRAKSHSRCRRGGRADLESKPERQERQKLLSQGPDPLRPMPVGRVTEPRPKNVRYQGTGRAA